MIAVLVCLWALNWFWPHCRLSGKLPPFLLLALPTNPLIQNRYMIYDFNFIALWGSFLVENFKNKGVSFFAILLFYFLSHLICSQANVLVTGTLELLYGKTLCPVTKCQFVSGVLHLCPITKGSSAVDPCDPEGGGSKYRRVRWMHDRHKCTRCPETFFPSLCRQFLNSDHSFVVPATRFTRRQVAPNCNPVLWKFGLISVVWVMRPRCWYPVLVVWHNCPILSTLCFYRC